MVYITVNWHARDQNATSSNVMLEWLIKNNKNIRALYIRYYD